MALYIEIGINKLFEHEMWFRKEFICRYSSLISSYTNKENNMPLFLKNNSIQKCSPSFSLSIVDFNLYEVTSSASEVEIKDDESECILRYVYKTYKEVCWLFVWMIIYLDIDNRHDSI